MEARATAKYVRVSPRKARLVVDQVRGKDIATAREILMFSERAVSEVVEKVLNSAVANLDSLFIDIKRNPKRYISIKLL